METECQHITVVGFTPLGFAAVDDMTLHLGRFKIIISVMNDDRAFARPLFPTSRAFRMPNTQFLGDSESSSHD